MAGTPNSALITIALPRKFDPGQIEHPGLRRLLEGLYQLQAEGLTPDLDHLRFRIDNPRLLARALEWQERGSATPDRQAYWRDLLSYFRWRREKVSSKMRSGLHHHRGITIKVFGRLYGGGGTHVVARTGPKTIHIHG